MHYYYQILRKLTSISLLLVMIFNLVGYQLLLRYWEVQKQKTLYTQKIEKESNPKQCAASAREEFTRLVSELQKTATKKTSEQNNTVKIKFSFSDYTVQQVAEYDAVVVTPVITFYPATVYLLPSPAAASPGQPPDSRG